MTVCEPQPSTAMVLHQTQKDFVDCTVPYKGFVAGRGSGKSFVGAYDFLVNTPPNTLGMILAPTFRMLDDSTKRTFMELARRLGLWNDNKHHKTDNRAILNNGVEVLFRSGDEPNKLRGPSVYRIWGDECSLLKDSVFDIAIACLRWPGADQLTFAGTFTPAGKDHWTYTTFGDETDPNVRLFRCSTRDNPFLPKAFYERLLLRYGKGPGGALRAAQELEGRFVCVEGAEWGAECFGPSIWFNTWPHDDKAVTVVSLDSSKGIGGKTGDYSCFCKMMFSGGKLWTEFDLDNQRNTSAMCARAIEIQKTFKPHYFGIESEFGGEVMADDLLNRAEQAKILLPVALVPTAGTPKEVRIRRLAPYITQGTMRFKNNEQTKLGVMQFESFPHAQHDDAPDACEMAVRLIREMG